MKRIKILSVFFFILVQVYSQTEKYFELGVGFSLTSVQDAGQSPLLYQCKSPTIHLGFLRISSDWIHEFKVEVQYGKMKNKYSPDFYEKKPFLVFGQLHYALNRTCMRFDNGLQFSPGLFVNLTANLRMIPKLENSMASYEIFPNIGLCERLQKNFSLKGKNFRLGHALYIPVSAYLMRSNYVSMMNYIDPKASYLGTIMSDGRMVSFSKLFRIKSEFELAYILKNNNQVKLSYLWDYYRCNTENISRTAQNGFVFSTLFNF